MTQKDILKSHELEIKKLEIQKELYNIQIDAAIDERKKAIHNILTPQLPYDISV
jgi:hypothetical protein